MSLPADGVNANTLAETTTIPTGKKLIFLDPDTNEGGIITLENLTKQILSNLTSQTFNLDQGNKTLLAALNELNSKALTEYAIDVTTSGTKLTAKFSDLGELDICTLFIFIVVGNDCYLSVQINHSTIYASRIVSVQGANVSMDTYTWDATNRVFTIWMTSNYDGVRKSKCYAIK